MSDHDIIMTTTNQENACELLNYFKGKLEVNIKDKMMEFKKKFVENHHGRSVEENWTSIKPHLNEMMSKHIL